jgi:hypothetical protein
LLRPLDLAADVLMVVVVILIGDHLDVSAGLKTRRVLLNPLQPNLDRIHHGLSLRMAADPRAPRSSG